MRVEIILFKKQFLFFYFKVSRTMGLQGLSTSDLSDLAWTQDHVRRPPRVIVT